MLSQKVTFPNAEGHSLSAKLELPPDQPAVAYAIFAHCFTCNKNLTAVRNISRALTSHGFGVLRFDFTGLGESEGDFADTNFSSNIQDLVSAARFLEQEYQMPSLLIGHSLGGAAVLYAAREIASVQAIATIGAPADPEHVSHLLKGGISELEREGVAQVEIGGRPFTIRKQFLDDIRSRDMETLLRDLKKPLLIFHSPQDNTVGIENAARIYNAAFHPKSFISLNGADHLLSSKADSLYVGATIAAWVVRYIEFPEPAQLETDSEVAARLGPNGYTTELKTGRHGWVADEPVSVGGNDFGPTPYQLVSAGLASCTAMTVQMYARRKKWPLQQIVVHVDHEKKHAEDTDANASQEGKPRQIDHFLRRIELEGDLSDEQVKRLLEIANKCPVHRTLESQQIHIQTELLDLLH